MKQTRRTKPSGRKLEALHAQANLLGEAMARIIENAVQDHPRDSKEAINLAWQAEQFRQQFSLAMFGYPKTIAEARRQLRQVKAMVAGALNITGLKKKALLAEIEALGEQRGYWNPPRRNKR